MAKQQPAKRGQKTKTAIKAYPKSRGHKAGDVDREVDARTVGPALLRLHGVTAAEYRVAGGRGEHGESSQRN